MKENTFLNNVKTKASALGMTALLTLNSVSLAFAEQTGGKATNPANEANNSINNFQICYVSYSRDSNTKWFRSMYLDDDG